MFEQLRIKVAIRQSLTLGIMLVIVLMLIFSYTVTRISTNIDANLEKMHNTRFYNFISEDVVENVEKTDTDRNTLAILIDGKNRIYMSDANFYNSATVETLIDVAINKGEPRGRMKIDGKFAAYVVQPSIWGTMIYVYDYTKDYENLRNMTVIIAISGAIGMVAIALLSLKFAKNSVAPIEAAFYKQQDLVANASHELKTPITIINTDLAILNASRENLTEEQCKWLDSIENQLDRMGALVAEMLELARIEGNKEQIKEQVNLSTAAESVVLGLEALAFEHNITFESDIKPDVSVAAVPAHIEKLIYILLENAVKYTDIGGKVTVSVSSERKKAILKVKNTGEGVERDKIPKLFDRFYRTDESHASTNSFGLGLAIAKSIVDAHGGTIGVDSKEGEYTEFVVILRQ